MYIKIYFLLYSNLYKHKTIYIIENSSNDFKHVFSDDRNNSENV